MLEKELKNERDSKNMFEEFDEWSKLHYYAFKLRKSYPNLFFHYFNYEGVIKDSFTMEERKTILTNLKKFKNNMNGMCGYLSLLLKNKNGILTYKMLNNSEFYDHSISTPCIQDASSRFSEEIYNKYKDIFKEKEILYQEVESEFEEYLESHSNESKRKEFKEFLEKNNNRILFAVSKSFTLNWMRQKFEENSSELGFIKQKEPVNETDKISMSKRRKIIIDEENNESQIPGKELRNPNKKQSSITNISTSPKENNSTENNMNTNTPANVSNYKPVDKNEWEKFVEKINSEVSDHENLTVNETGNSSPNKYYLKSQYNPDYIYYDDLNKGYVSDQGKKVFKSERKKYASDEEDFKTDETITMKRKILIVKSSNKIIKDELQVGVFSLQSSEINKLKRQLLNKKTKRDSNLKEKKEEVKQKELVKIKKREILGKIQNNSVIEKKSINTSKLNVSNSKKKVFKYSNMSIDDFTNKSRKSWDDKSVSNISTNSILNNRKIKMKSYASSIKNFFSAVDKKSEISSTNQNLYKTVFSKEAQVLAVGVCREKTIKNQTILTGNDSQTGKSILSYFPKTSNALSNRETEIIKTLSRLINNNKYSDLLSLIDKKNQYNYNEKNILDSILSNISSITVSLVNTTNDIDTSNLETIMINEFTFRIDQQSFEFRNQPAENLKILFEFYKKNTICFISNDEYVPIEENENLSKVGKNLISAENLIKYIIKNYQRIVEFRENFTFDSIMNEIKEIFLFFLGKIFATKLINESSEDDGILSEVIINRLIAFLMIIKVIYLQNYLKNMKEMTIHFLKILSFLILIKIFWIDVKSLASENYEMIIYISLFQIVSDIFSVFSNNNQNDLQTNSHSFVNNSFALMNSVFQEFLTPESKILDTKNNTDLKSEFIENCKKLLYRSYFDQKTFEKNFKSLMYKIFITQTNKIYTLYEFSSELKKIFLSDAILILYKRYFNLFILILCNPNADYNNSTFSQIEEFYTNNKNDSYFDLDAVFKSIDDKNLKSPIGLEFRKNLMYRYLLSDCNTILILDETWKMDAYLKMKIIFRLFAVIGLTQRKNIIANDHINKKLLHKLLDFIFKENDADNLPEENDSNTLMNFVVLVCRIIRNTLLKNETDDKGRRRILTRFVDLLNENKNLYENTHLASTSENSTKLGILPIFAITLSLIEFTNIFEANDKIESCVRKISDILDFNKSSTLLKGFNIAILLRIILKFHKKKMNIDKYVQLLNINIRSVINQIIEYEKMPNINDIPKLKNEHYETLDYYLRTLSKISNENTSLLVNNFMILDELKEIIKDILESNTIPKNYKAMVYNILNNCSIKFESIVMNDANNLKNESENKLIYDGCEIDLDELEFGDDNEISIKEFKKENLKLNESHLAFLENLNKIYVNLLSKIIKSFFNFQSINNAKSNVNAKQKISIDLMKQNCEVLSKIIATLIKFSNFKYSEFFQYFSFNSPFFSKKIRSCFSVTQDYVEILTIPFKAFNCFLQIYPEILTQILNKKEYKFFTHFIRLFFYSLFYRAKNTYNPLIQRSQNECSVYIHELITKLSKEKNLIEYNLSLLKRESESRILSEIQREASSYYNILIFMINHFNQANEVTSDFTKLENYFELLLQNISLNKDIFKIESKFFFSLIDEEIEDIYRIFEDVPNYSGIVRNVHFKIINFFSIAYLNDKLNENLEEFIKKFIKNSILEKKEDIEMKMSLIYNSTFNSFIYLMLDLRRCEKNRVLLHLFLNTLINSVNSEILNLQIDMSLNCDNPVSYSKIFTELKIQENLNFKQTENYSIISSFDQISYLMLILEYFSTEYLFHDRNNPRFTTEFYYYLIYSILKRIRKIENIDEIKLLYERVFNMMNIDNFRLLQIDQAFIINNQNHNLFLMHILFSINSEINFYFDSFEDYEYDNIFIENILKFLAMNIIYLCENFSNGRSRSLITKLSNIFNNKNISTTNRREEIISVHNIRITDFFTNHFVDNYNEYIETSMHTIKILKDFYYNNSKIYEDVKTLELYLCRGNIIIQANSDRLKLFTELL